MRRHIGTIMGALLGLALASCGGDPGNAQFALVTDTGRLTDEQARELVDQACPGPFSNHGHCVSCAAHALSDLRNAEWISGAQHGSVTSWYAHNGCSDGGGCTPITCGMTETDCGTLADGCGGWLVCGPPC